MFTGIVEGCGTVRRTVPEGPGRLLVIELPPDMRTGDYVLGESVALNGCCLTVVACDADSLAFQAGPETLAKTNLGQFEHGLPVNLERALKANARLGGHFVQGHIDGTGTIATIDHAGDWVTIRFRVPPELTRQMVSKGSIAVDGVSLTLVDVARDSFSVALIPHTLQVTNLGRKQVGETVNIETDILGKYIIKLMNQERA